MVVVMKGALSHKLSPFSIIVVDSKGRLDQDDNITVVRKAIAAVFSGSPELISGKKSNLSDNDAAYQKQPGSASTVGPFLLKQEFHFLH